MPNPREVKKIARATMSQETLRFINDGLGLAIKIVTDEPLGKFKAFLETSGLIRSACRLPKGTNVLRDGLHRLNGMLSIEEGHNPLTNPLSAFTALVLADALTYQTALPLERRAAYKLEGVKDTMTKQNAMIALASIGSQYQDEATAKEHDRLVQKIGAFQEYINIVLALPSENSDKFQAQLRISDAATRLREQSYIPFAILDALGSPAMKRFIEKIDEKGLALAGNPLAAQLLFQGELEDLNTGLKAIIWGSPLNDKVIIEETDKDDPRFQEIPRYFFDHPEIQEGFWKAFLLNNPIPIPSHARDVLGVDRLLIYHPTIEWFFMQDAEMVADFLVTRAIPGLASQQNESLMRRLTGVNLIFRRRLPENSNNRFVARALEALASDTGALLQDEFAVVLDRSPGIVYLDQRNEARARIPKPGQTKDAFISQEEKRGTEIIYVSQAPWPEPRIAQEPSISVSVAEPVKKPEEPKLKVNPVEVEFLDHWGGVGIVEAQDIAKVIEFLDKKVGVTEDEAFNLLDEYTNRRKGSVAHVILPSILPDNELIKRLANVGVLAVSRDGSEVNFIIDPQAAKIDVDGNVNLISLKGVLNQQDELIFEGETADTSTTSTHLLMNAAAVLAGTLIIVEPRKGKPLYSDQELREVGKKIDEWNTRVRAQNLPTLRYGEHQPSDGPRVLLPIDKTFAFPTLAAK